MNLNNVKQANAAVNRLEMINMVITAAKNHQARPHCYFRVEMYEDAENAVQVHIELTPFIRYLESERKDTLDDLRELGVET